MQIRSFRQLRYKARRRVKAGKAIVGIQDIDWETLLQLATVWLGPGCNREMMVNLQS